MERVRRAAVLLLTLGAHLAWACPTCTCGNPALLSIGADQPFDGRLRFGSTLRAWGQRETDGTSLRELRLDVLASWSPLRRWTFALNLPVQVRERTELSLARERGFGPGELDLSGRVLLVGADGFRPRHLVSAVLSARLPTAPTLVDGATQQPLAVDAQLGPGAFVPGGGLTWAAFIGDQVSTFVSLMGEVPLEGRYGLRIGPQVQLIASVQYQPWKFLGVRAGVDTRYEAPSALRGVTQTRFSGALLQALVDVVVSPVSTVLITVGARLPFADLRVGQPAQTPILLLSFVVDV
jgi:hypothetical protein